MRCIFFLIFISGLAFGQEKAPFKQFDEANKKEYSSQEKAIEQSRNTALEKINLRILLASKYKAQDDLIVALKDKIKLKKLITTNKNCNNVKYRILSSKILEFLKFFIEKKIIKKENVNPKINE